MDNYAQKAVNAIRGLPDQADGVVLWEVPVADFAAWRAMPDTPRYNPTAIILPHWLQSKPT